MNGKLANEFKEKIPLLNHSDVSACLLSDRGGVRKGARRAAAESALHWIRVSCIIECFFPHWKIEGGRQGSGASTNSPGRSLLILIPPFSGLTSGIVGMGIPLVPTGLKFPKLGRQSRVYYLLRNYHSLRVTCCE